ncbi:MAG: transketolase [Candidatus Aenigmarchaeota archaeon]|nr:transketolase [Candidatus Aenigmarchaeota archaeon]
MQNYAFEAIQLGGIAKKVRLELVKLCRSGNSGHLSSCLSCVEILVSLYFSKMNHDDKFILSKGHAAPLLYVVLSERGIMPKGRLSTYKRIGGLEEHPLFGEGIEVPTGSLGQGISVANGLALAKRLDKDGGHVYVLLGDGECDEGQIWESAATASKYSLSNVTAIIDRNGVQSDGPTEEIKQKNDLAEKFRAFGWEVIIADGNDFSSLERALSVESEKPKVIIANTIRGKGVSFIEENPRYYYGTMSSADFDGAIKELEA